MSNVKLIWVTPSCEKIIMYTARVSSPHQDSEDTKLLKYLLKHKHFSPFEMASLCVEITTSRAISAQILRHKSFCFQEFSGRYAQHTNILTHKARRQDVKNRQNSFEDLPDDIQNWWLEQQEINYDRLLNVYEEALEKGIAKECARMILPLATETKLYMTGSIRSWLHYFQLRCAPETQLEHREIANEVKVIFKQECPIIGELI